LKRVIKIGDVDLDHKLFISSEFDVDDFLSQRVVAIDGSSVVFVQPKGSMTKEVSITSKNSGWISEDTKQALTNMIGTDSISITFDDNTSANYYFDHTKTPLKFSSLYEGSLWYNVEINLLKG